jgi:hypothetical protein
MSIRLRRANLKGERIVRPTYELTEEGGETGQPVRAVMENVVEAGSFSCVNYGELAPGPVDYLRTTIRPDRIFPADSKL